MASDLGHVGDVGSIVQLTGLNAIAIIGLIVKAANTARMHKKNCKRFAEHVKLIGNLLEQLKISELKSYPETREPLEKLEDALRRAYHLVRSCEEKSYLYLLAMGWCIVNQFKRAHEEIDRYLRIVPLISLVTNARLKKRLECIQKDQCEYTFDEVDRKAHVAIQRQEPSRADTVVLMKSLSHSYPELPLNEALEKENEKLKVELQHCQSNRNPGQCEVIQRLIRVTETVARNSREMTIKPQDARGKEKDSVHEREIPSISASPKLSQTKESHHHEQWHTDLFDCCSDLPLCVKTFFFPCGTFSKIASVVNKREITSAQVCNALIAYSLILACCCYTCSVRRRLRKALNIEGGCCDDFFSHLLCCCCSLVQEWREVKISGTKDPSKTMTTPPSAQHMES